MHLPKESRLRLNEQALLLRSDAATFKIHYWGVESRLPSNPVHRHSFFEICYVMDGIGEYTDDGSRFPISAGVHLCSRPGKTHQILTEEGLFLLHVGFELDRARSQPFVLRQFDEMGLHGSPWIKEETPGPTALLWQSLLVHDRAGGALSEPAFQLAVRALLFSFPALFNPPQSPPAPKRRVSNLLAQAKLFVCDNIAEPLSLSGVARYLNVSERHLSRLFNDGIHESFTGFVRGERVRQAEELLKDGELPIKEIAERVGFSSVHYFTRSFAKEKGMPPGSYRERYRRSAED